MQPTYRNHTSTLAQIQMLATMRITTTQEAVAFLRAMQPINLQIAQVLQRNGLREQHNLNRATVVEQPQPEVEPIKEEVPAPTNTFEPEDLTTEEGFTEEEVEAKVAKLKSARKKGKK